MTLESTFYDINPFNYGYSSENSIIESMHPSLKYLMEQNKGKVFCDIGCGCGRNLLYACRFASKVIGVDLSVKSLALAQSFVKSENLELKNGNNLDIPLDNDTADIVISDGVCHHTGDTQKAFSECIRILKPGGRLYLAVYKKFRYYPFIYYFLGGLFRFLYRFKYGIYVVDNVAVKIHYIMYKFFKIKSLSRLETRYIFYDY